MTEVSRGRNPRITKKKPLVPIWGWMLLVVLVIFALPTVVLLALGLIPSYVATFVDRRPQKYAAFCVSGFNLAGIIPYLAELWASGHNSAQLVAMLSSPFMWAVIFGCAALGWLVHFGIPPIASSLTLMRDRRRVQALYDRQMELREEWGDDIVPPRLAGDEDDDMAPPPADAEMPAM